MASINTRSVQRGALLGGLVFLLWSMFMEFGVSYLLVGKERMQIAMNAGWFLKEPRVPVWLFFIVWILCLFVVSYGLAWAYAAMRATLGAGPKTALMVGAFVGFAAGVPLQFAHGAFEPLSGRYTILWMLEMFLGCIFAALTAGKAYRAPADG